MSDKTLPTIRFAFMGLGFVVLILLLRLFWPIMLPFISGIVLAYLFDPMVRRMGTWGLPRWAGALVVVAGLVLVLMAACAVGVPLALNAFLDASQHLPGRLNHLIEAAAPLLHHYIGNLDPKQLAKELSSGGTDAITFMTQIVQQASLQTLALINLASLLVITPMVMFYILRDWPQFVDKVVAIFPRPWLPATTRIMNHMDEALSGFLRGQLTVCVLLGCFYSTGLWACGLQGGALIGMATGLFSFVPILGMTAGVAIAFTVAIVQYQLESGMAPYLWLAGVFILGQMLEGMVLTPNLVGSRVKLHPGWVVFAVLAGGQVGGLAGVVIALPVAAVLNVLVKEGAAWWAASNMYKRMAKTAPAARKKPAQKTT